MVGAFLPADQGHALMKAAGAVMELHSECSRVSKRDALAAASCQPLTRSDLDSTTAGKGVEPQATTSPPAAEGVPQSRSLIDLGGVAAMSDMLNKAVLADPAGTIFSAAENVRTDKTDYDDGHMDGGASGVHTDEGGSGREKGAFFGENSASEYSGVDIRRRSATIGSQDIPRSLFDGKPHHDTYDDSIGNI